MKVHSFRDTRTNKVVTKVPISEIEHFEEYDGPTIWACDECGSTDLQATAWIELNSGKVMGDEPPTDQVWCQKCDQECSWHGIHEIAKPVNGGAA